MRKIFLCTLFVLPLLAAGKSETFSGTILSTEEDFCGNSVDYVLQASLATESLPCRAASIISAGLVKNGVAERRRATAW